MAYTRAPVLLCTITGRKSTTLTILAGPPRKGLSTACSWLTMARESASKVWTPGDPILFANTSAVDGSSSSGNATSNKRLPFATVRTTKQARQNKKDEGGKNREVYKSSAGPCQRQGTLSPWAKSAWKPGMPVKLAKAPLSTTTTIDATQLQNSFKGKEKEVPASLPDENRHAHW